MDILGQASTQLILFFILYGITGVVPLIGAIYLLLRRSNAFAPDVTPPLRLRRWAASFLAVSALAHVWWMLFYIYSRELYSVTYMLVVGVDYVCMVTTITGTMLSMLQDRRRPIWPAFMGMTPFLVLEVLHMRYPDGRFADMAIAYNLSLYVLFFIYMVFAVRRYGRWLNDNYADLENKRVWLSQAVSLAFVLLFILYVLVDTNDDLLYFLHGIELVFFGLLVWRVESLPQLEKNEPSTPLTDREGQESTSAVNIDLTLIERLLADHCVDKQLYLQHDLTLQQLAQAIGTNRSYLSQYFSRQGITYNTYINNLRINHFISSYQKATADGRPFTAQQLARDSGYRSYSTFSLAFKQRTGQSVSAWTRQSPK
jgi:AraC-like DNA-binding protein